MRIKQANYKSPGKSGQRGFEDLECYQLALDIVVNVHKFTKHLPPEEKYDLAAQIRRSAKSITANIAEGYGRYHYLDSLRYYSIARGELNETLAHFVNALVLEYIDSKYYEEIYALVRKTEALLNGFMSCVRKQRTGATEFGNQASREEPAHYIVDRES